MVGSGYQSCRIFCARFQVVQWRVTSEVFEHLLAVFTGAVIAGPVPADGKLVVAEHIHHTYLRDGYTEEVGTLRHTGAYQQTAVGTADNRYLVFIGVFLADEIFSGRDEVVEHVLFLHFGSGYVPVLTVFAAATQVDLGIDTAVFEERDTVGAEARIETDTETSVPVEEYRIFAVFLQVLLISKEHRNLHTVLAGEKHLFRYEVVRVELHFRGTVQFVAVLVHIIFIGSAGNGERGKSEEAFLVILVAAESYRTERGQFDFLQLLAVEVVNVCVIGGVFVVCEEQFATDHFRVGEHCFRFGHEFFPVFQFRTVDVRHHNPVFRCAVVGVDINPVADYFNWVILVIEVGGELDERRGGLFQIPYEQVVPSSGSGFGQK